MPKASPNPSKAPAPDFSGPLLVGLLAGDEPEVRKVLGDARSGGRDVAEIAHDVIGPALREVGEMWHRGELSIAEEHLATALVARGFASVTSSIPLPPPGSPRILFTCLEGEFHDLGIRILSDVAREAGWEAENLGANVPRQAMVDFVAVRRPDALGLSICLAAHVAEAVRTIEQVREVAPGIRILVGGRAVASDPLLGDSIPADVVAPNVLVLRDWLGKGGPRRRSSRSCLPDALPASLRRRLAARRRPA